MERGTLSVVAPQYRDKSFKLLWTVVQRCDARGLLGLEVAIFFLNGWGMPYRSCELTIIGGIFSD